MALRNKALNRKLVKPMGVQQAFRILNGFVTGDVKGAEVFLDSLSTTERRIRGRAEQRENSRQTLFSKRGYPSLLQRARAKKGLRYG